MEDPKHPLVGAHPIKHTNGVYWEFHITDNDLVIYKRIEGGYEFLKIGSHDDLDKY